MLGVMTFKRRPSSSTIFFFNCRRQQAENTPKTSNRPTNSATKDPHDRSVISTLYREPYFLHGAKRRKGVQRFYLLNNLNHDPNAFCWRTTTVYIHTYLIMPTFVTERERDTYTESNFYPNNTHQYCVTNIYTIQTFPHPTIIIIIIRYPLTARVVGASQMILQPVFSIFPSSPPPSGTCRTPGLSIP